MKIKELREKNKVTQRELANFLNIAPSTFNGYEKETSEPNIATLKKIANYFNVSLDYLCENEQSNAIYYFDNDQKVAVDILFKLPDEYFYQFLGRLKTTADYLNIKYWLFIHLLTKIKKLSITLKILFLGDFMKQILENVLSHIDTLRKAQRQSANMADFIYQWRTSATFGNYTSKFWNAGKFHNIKKNLEYSMW